MMVFILAISHFSMTAFAETNIDKGDKSIGNSDLNNIDQLLDTYYYFNSMDTTNISQNNTVHDPYTMLDRDSNINNNKLIEMFSTNTNTKSELLQLCKNILNGEKLADQIESDQDLYTITTDSVGNATGYAVIDLDSFSIKEFGELNEYTRKDFQLTESMQKNIAKIDLDLSTSKVVFCTINNFATGNLVYDKNNEYFIPSVESIESVGLLEVGNIYPVYELAKTIENNIDNIFPTNQIDEQGNPYIGGTTIQSESTESNVKNNTQTSIHFYIVGVVGMIVCLAIIIKIIKCKNNGSCKSRSK